MDFYFLFDLSIIGDYFIWLVEADKGGRWLEIFLNRNCIGIGQGRDNLPQMAVLNLYKSFFLEIFSIMF